MIKLGNNNIGKIYLGSNAIGKAYLGSNLVYQAGGSPSPGPEPEPSMTLLRYWDGSDQLVSTNRWEDREVGQAWVINGGSYNSTYYEFLNPDPGVLSQYANAPTAFDDLGYHWKIEVDLSINILSSAPRAYVPIDFGAIGSVASGKCGVGIDFSPSANKWELNPKFNGDDSSPFMPDLSEMPADSGAVSGSWLRRKITIGVSQSTTEGYDYSYIDVENVGRAVSPLFQSMRFNNWVSNSYFIARPLIGVNTSNRKYATSTRIYSIKIYTEPVE